MMHERTAAPVDPAARLRWDGSVPKYDAFGREIGEDTLSGLGGDSSASEASARPAESWTEAQVAEAAAFGATAVPAEPAAPPEPQPRPQPMAMPGFDVPAPAAPVIRVRRRGGVGCLVGLVILIAIVAVPIVALVSFVDEAGNTIDEITGAIDSAPDVAPVPVAPEPPARPPTGLGGASLVSQPNFGKALARLEKAGIGRVTFIRLAPERLDAQLVKGSRQRSAQVTFEGDVTRGPTAPGGGNLATVPFSAIDRSAPARLVRASAARFSVREKGINYLVLSFFPGEGHRWVAYFKNGTYVLGDRHGAVVRRIN
jgi:hypothetical protein